MIAATLSITGCAYPMSRYSSAQPLPTKLDAAKAYVAYEENVCGALIDICDGIPDVRGEAIDGLSCRREPQETAVCRFEYAGRRCQARFVRSEGLSNGWMVAFRNRVPKGSDIECAGVH